MARGPDTPCKRCGKLLWSGSTSSPAAQRVCRPCRQEAPERRTDRTCGTCASRHFAKGLCRRHYNQSRREAGLDGRRPVMYLQGVASLHGAYFPKAKTIRCSVAVGLIAWCPNCRASMGATGPASRICHHCGTTVRLNAEEVSWVISETHSIRRLKQTT